MTWRHRFICDRWGWEPPAGLVEPGEDPAETAAPEVDEDTGWRPLEMVQAVGFQPMVGTVDSPHAVYISRGADHVGGDVDPAEAAKIDWLPLRRLRSRAGVAPAPRFESAEAEAEPRPPGADDAAAGWSKPRVSPVPVCLPRRAKSRTTGHNNNNLPAPRLSAPVRPLREPA